MQTLDDGSVELVFTSSDTQGAQDFRDYKANFNVFWLGNEPFKISDYPETGQFSLGAPGLDGVWEIDVIDLPSLGFVPPNGYAGSVDLNFTLESTGETESMTVDVAPVADNPIISASNFSGFPERDYDLSISITDTDDTDGSESQLNSITLSDVPADITLSASAGTTNNDGGGIWSVSRGALDTLQVSGLIPGTTIVTVSGTNRDEVDVDGDTAFEDGDNGSGIDEISESTVQTTFELTIRELVTVDFLLTDDDTPLVTGTSAYLTGDTLEVTVAGAQYDGSDGQLVIEDNGNWSLQIPDERDLNDGEYEVVATLTDSAGTAVSDTTSLELEVDTRIFKQSTLEVNTYTPVLTGTTIAPDGSEIVVTDASGNELCTSIVSDGAWSCELQDPLAEGTNDLTAIIDIPEGGGEVTEIDVIVSDDFDDDGLINTLEGDADSDGDGVPNWYDLDSDNDGVLDSNEGAGDNDDDSLRNAIDLDSDNDGINDLAETLGLYSDEDGLIDNFVDDNADGLHDSLQATGAAQLDTDNDLIPDYQDVDSDQDGLTDLLESGGIDEDNDGRVDGFEDVAGDGADDARQMLGPSTPDTDLDGVPDWLDLDADNDGKMDIIEAGGIDIDGNGKVDASLDSDDDGLPDSVDVDQTGALDADSDGIDDNFDASFASTDDSDGDDIIDSADIDANGDGLIDDVVNALSTGGELPDTNGNGVSDLLESEGRIKTGLVGHAGCSINGAGGQTLMWLMLVVSAVLLLHRRQKSRASASAGNTGASNSRLKNIDGRGCTQLAIVIMAVLVAGCAAPSGSEFNKRFYAGAGFLVSNLEPDTDDVFSTDVDESQSSGGSIALGYDITNRFSVEGHIADLGKATLTPEGEIEYMTGGVSALVYGLNKEADRARREGFSVYGRLGLGVLETDATDVEITQLNDVHLLAGIGLEYGFSNGLGLRAELVSHDEDANYAQLGIVYRIGDIEEPAREYIAPKVVMSEAAETPKPVGQVVEKKITAVTPMATDTDNDGVTDLEDKCLGSPDDISVNSDGCSVLEGVIDKVNFMTDSAQLTDTAALSLQIVAKTLMDYPDVRVLLAAHTDDEGAEDTNLELSKRRAVSVVRYLVAHGISVSRIRARAFGESRPIASNQTAEGRATNRRIEIAVDN